ncbi:molybdopterin-dependent oxidoreductase [Streptomyces sp. NPDC088253]|uniref:molybdopterin-dependent oxidoreductase n=1 Tax=Streptomyces sp. NPDC088253 TaxID=3365846 RepID=UPI003807513E
MWGVPSGLVAAFSALCVAELVSAAVRPEAGPVTAVGGAVIDRTPLPVKDWAVRTFGTADKLVLQWGVVALLAVFAALIGPLALRHRRTGAAAVAAVGRPDGSPPDGVPSAVGGAVAAGVLYLLATLLDGRPSTVTGRTGAFGRTRLGRGLRRAVARGPGHEFDREFDRRGFVIAAGATVVASAGAGLLGRRLKASGNAEAAASRERLVLPAPASPAPPLPGAAALHVPGISPRITPNRRFYRVDTALVVPRVDVSRWRLRLHGKGVRRPLELRFQDLLDRELVERDITLTCVSNEVGGPYVGNARWIGVRLADLLREAGVRPPSEDGPADQLVARSVDGMTLGAPVDTVMDGRDALLALGMNGEPLPFEHGFPVRMVVPGLYGYVSACKWLRELELATFDDFDAYWVRRGWAREAPVKTQSRIDTPHAFASPKAGPVQVAGVAWAQHRGITRVEVRVDDGPWRTARLAAQDSRDTWRQWSWQWEATAGHHTLQVRATDGTGALQTDRRSGTVPDGATGRHAVVVSVS